MYWIVLILVWLSYFLPQPAYSCPLNKYATTLTQHQVWRLLLWRVGALVYTSFALPPKTKKSRIFNETRLQLALASPPASSQPIILVHSTSLNLHRPLHLLFFFLIYVFNSSIASDTLGLFAITSNCRGCEEIGDKTLGRARWRSIILLSVSHFLLQNVPMNKYHDAFLADWGEWALYEGKVQAGAWPLTAWRGRSIYTFECSHLLTYFTGVCLAPDGDEHFYALDPSPPLYLAKGDIPFYLRECSCGQIAIWNENYIYFHLDSFCWF